MATTDTPAEPDSPRRGAARRISLPDYLLLIGFLLAGAALAFLSLPRAIAHLEMMPDREFLTRVRTGEADRAEALRGFIARRTDALTVHESGLGWSEVAEALTALASHPEGTAADFETARWTTRLGLAARPADARAWLRLARLETMLRGPSPAALAAYGRSLALNERSRALMPARLAFAFSHWDRLDRPLRLKTRDQIRLYWRALPNDLVLQVLESDWLEVVRQALARRPEDLWSFERKLFEYWRHLPDGS